ncbi:MAG: acetate/propionate family kinase [Chloroflexota bacterium]
MILIINCGSSTIKYQLFTTDVSRVVARGIISRIGEDGSYFDYQTDQHTIHEIEPVANHHRAFEICIACLLHPEYGAIRSIDEIQAVGHRAVHGADLFIASTQINEDVIRKMEECVPLAPLHNPPNLVGIREARLLLPNVPHVAVFDTAFNQTMPPKAYLYALPYRLYEEHKIRKYGFHGTSVRYVSRQAAQFLQRPIEELKMVVLHLGNGVTMTAVDGGKAVDSTIGFATFSGVMMGTRSGDIDPGLVFHFQRELGMSLEQVERMVYRESGLLGLSGVSNDLREVEKHAQQGNHRCELAIEKFAYMAKNYIGSFAAAMGGLNCVVFTAGIGENSPRMRAQICQEMEYFGICLDESKNLAAVGGKAERVISQPGWPTSVVVVPTNEEKMIALDTMEISGLGQA